MTCTAGTFCRKAAAGGSDTPARFDLHGERLELSSTSQTPNPPLALQFRAWDFLSTPHWDAAADVNKVPLSTLIEVARHMGAATPQNLMAEGSVSGAVRYSEPDGLTGRLEMQDALVNLPDAQPLRAANCSGAVQIDREAVSLEPATVQIGDDESAGVEASYAFSGGNAQVGLDLKITTRNLSVAHTRSFGMAAIPLLDQVLDQAPAHAPQGTGAPQGTWRGSVRYHLAPSMAGEEHGEWSGEYELQNARVTVEGLADPLRIQSAAVSLNGPRVSVTRLRARARFDCAHGRISLGPQGDSAAPVSHHDSRSRRRGAGAPLDAGPDTGTRISGAHAAAESGAVTGLAEGPPRGRNPFGRIAQLRHDSRISGLTERNRVLWDGAVVRLLHAKAHLDQASLNADIALDLSGRAPLYRADGKLTDFAYDGGKLDFEGSLEGDVFGSARAEGSVRGRSIAFAPDADFRNVAGCFEMINAAAGPRWKLTELEVLEGAETYYGTGATQPDGRLALELSGHGRQLHVSSGPPVVASQ